DGTRPPAPAGRPRRHAGLAGRGPGAGQCHPHRRAGRFLRPLPRHLRPHLPRLRPAGGGGYGPRRPRHPGGGDPGRPPEQARCRHGPRPAMDRPARRRHDLRGQQLRHRARPGRPRTGEEQGPGQQRRPQRRNHRRALLRQHHPLDGRYLDAGQLGRPGDGQERRRQLVLHHRRLRLRPPDGAGPDALHRHRRRAGAGRGALPLPGHLGFLLLPRPGPGEPRQGGRAADGRRGHGQLHQAGAGIRHQPPGTAGWHADVRHRHPRHGPRGGAGADGLRGLLLGPQRPHPRLPQPREAEDADQHPEPGTCRHLFRRPALPEGGGRSRPGARQGKRPRGGAAHEGDAGRRRLLRPRPGARGRTEDPPGLSLRGEGARREQGRLGLLQAHRHRRGRGGLPPAERGRLPAGPHL
ncbi:MAG: ABC transporter, substrate-binding protein (cluster 4, leucine/isoleucine/valine/benzoate), partial [uncultured Craurococcus sp.]